MLIGLPGSGKSTWAQRVGATVLSSVAMRIVLSGDVNDQTIHGKVFGAMRHLLKSRLEIGASPTIIDSTNLRRRDRKPWIRLAKKLGARREAVYFDVPVKTALERNRKRSRQVPEEVIQMMTERMQMPTVQEGFDSVETISW